MHWSVLTRSVATASVITNAFDLIVAARDSPKEIDNLRKEHDSLVTALESLNSLVVRSSQNKEDPDSTFVEQVKTVISDTGKTLNELQTTIAALQPSGDRTGKRAALQIRCKYFFKERTIQAIMARIKARREALMLLLNMWSRFVLAVFILANGRSH